MIVTSKNQKVSIIHNETEIELDNDDAIRLAEIIVTELTYKPEVINYFINSSEYDNSITENEDIICIIADECRSFKDCNETLSIFECISSVIDEFADSLESYKISM